MSLNESLVAQVPNFSQVVEGIARGGCPTDEGWSVLEAAGYRKVVKLNTDKESDDSVAVDLGIEVLRFPINLWQQVLLEPSETVVNAALVNVVPGTFVHCGSQERTDIWLSMHDNMTAGGNDRTGLIIGLYRVQHGWSAADAWNEMLVYGFHSELLGLKMYWQTHNGA